jgi:hypothetical protein
VVCRLYVAGARSEETKPRGAEQMKKVLWMLVAVAMLGMCSVAKAQAAAGDKPAHKAPVTVNGTVKVDGDNVCIVADDGTYTVKSKSDKAIADLKAKDGQKVTVKGWVKEDGGKKILNLAGGHGKKKDAGATPAPAAGGDNK